MVSCSSAGGKNINQRSCQGKEKSPLEQLVRSGFKGDFAVDVRALQGVGPLVMGEPYEDEGLDGILLRRVILMKCYGSVHRQYSVLVSCHERASY